MSTKYLKFTSGVAAAFVFAALSTAALAQSGGGTATPATCATAASAVTALNLEQVLSLSNVLATVGPPPPVGVVNGTQEIHQSFVFDAQSSTLNITTFLAPKGAAIPTNPVTITAANTLQLSTVRINQIVAGTTPSPSLMMLGTLISGPPGGFPSSIGTPVVITMGYSTALGFSYFNVVNNFALIVAGQVVSWSPTATGIFTVGYPPKGTVAAYCTGS